jgi:hypothetical protein
MVLIPILSQNDHGVTRGVQLLDFLVVQTPFVLSEIGAFSSRAAKRRGDTLFSVPSFPFLTIAFLGFGCAHSLGRVACLLKGHGSRGEGRLRGDVLDRRWRKRRCHDGCVG